MVICVSWESMLGSTINFRQCYLWWVHCIFAIWARLSWFSKSKLGDALFVPIQQIQKQMHLWKERYFIKHSIKSINIGELYYKVSYSFLYQKVNCLTMKLFPNWKTNFPENHPFQWIFGTKSWKICLDQRKPCQALGY